MQTQKIDLYEYFGITRPKDAKGYLTTYLALQAQEHCKERLRPAMVVIPGGGYECISEREGEPICIAYMAKGYNAFLLDYSLVPNGYPTQLIEGCMAIAYIKANSEKLHVDKNQVVAIGFSAGGHLAGTLATMTKREEVQQVLSEYKDIIRPDAVVLSYPVVTSLKDIPQRTMTNICNGDKSKFSYLSVDKAVDSNSSPAFIWTTVDDEIVPSENSLLLACAYKKAGVPFEFHLFRHGNHGLSLATRETANYPVIEPLIAPDLAVWVDLSVTFLKGIGFDIVK